MYVSHHSVCIVGTDVHSHGHCHGHCILAIHSIISSLFTLAGYPESVGKGYRNFAAGQMVSMVIK